MLLLGGSGSVKKNSCQSVSCSIRLPNTSGVIDRCRKRLAEVNKDRSLLWAEEGSEEEREAVEICRGRRGMDLVRTYLCPRVKVEGCRSRP